MKTSKRIRTLLISLIVLALSASVHGGQMFPIVTTNADTCASIVSDGTNYLVGIQGDYAGTNMDGTGKYYITAQMFNPTGALIGWRINPVPGHTGGNPELAWSGTNYLMVWPDDYLDGNYSSISAQLISPSGGLIGGMIAITANSAQELDAVAYGGGKYLVVWNDYSNGTNWNIYGQIVSASGALVGGNLFISAPVNGKRSQGASAAFDGTNFLVVWQFSSATNHYVTYGVFISPGGVVGTPFAIGQTVSPTTIARGDVGLRFNGTNYFVVWLFDSEIGGTGNPILNIYGRFVTPTGTFPGNEFAIVTDGNPQLLSGLAFDGANYLLCWNEGGIQSPTNTSVPFQFLNLTGQPIGPQFTPFMAQGNEMPLLAPLLYDGRRFVSAGTLSTNGWSATNKAVIYGAFIPASTAPPQFGTGASYGNKQFSLSLAGTPGINYAIQMATSLVAPSWTSLVTNSPTNGTFTYTDPNATNSNRFYRALKQ
jgi:hypothetical protein